MWWWSVLLAACGLVGCSTMQPAQQPSYVLRNVDAQCVKGVILGSLVDQGFVVRTATESQIVAARNAIGGGLGAFLAPDEQRTVSVLLIPMSDGDVRVVISEAFVSQTYLGTERTSYVYPAGQGSYSVTGQSTQAQCSRGGEGR